MTLELAKNRRHGEGRERRAPVGVIAVDGLQQADARHLNEVLCGLVGALESSCEPACERQEALRQLVAGGHVPLLVVPAQQAALLGEVIPAWRRDCRDKAHLPASGTSPLWEGFWIPAPGSRAPHDPASCSAGRDSGDYQRPGRDRAG